MDIASLIKYSHCAYNHAKSHPSLPAGHEIIRENCHVCREYVVTGSAPNFLISKFHLTFYFFFALFGCYLVSSVTMHDFREGGVNKIKFYSSFKKILFQITAIT